MKKLKYRSKHEAKHKLRWAGKLAITTVLAVAPLLQSVAEFPLAPATVHAVTTAAPTSTYNPAKDNVAADEAAIPTQPTRPALPTQPTAPTIARPSESWASTYAQTGAGSTDNGANPASPSNLGAPSLSTVYGFATSGYIEVVQFTSAGATNLCASGGSTFGAASATYNGGNFAATSAGFQQALYAIYTANAPTASYAIYFGSSTTISDKVVDSTNYVYGGNPSTPATITSSNIYIGLLKGRAKGITWVANSTDPLSGAAESANNTVTISSTSASGTTTQMNNYLYNYVPTAYRNINIANAYYSSAALFSLQNLSASSTNAGALALDAGTYLLSGPTKVNIYGPQMDIAQAGGVVISPTTLSDEGTYINLKSAGSTDSTTLAPLGQISQNMHKFFSTTPAVTANNLYTTVVSLPNVAWGEIDGGGTGNSSDTVTFNSSYLEVDSVGNGTSPGFITGGNYADNYMMTGSTNTIIGAPNQSLTTSTSTISAITGGNYNATGNISGSSNLVINSTGTAAVTNIAGGDYNGGTGIPGTIGTSGNGQGTPAINLVVNGTGSGAIADLVSGNIGSSTTAMSSNIYGDVNTLISNTGNGAISGQLVDGNLYDGGLITGNVNFQVSGTGTGNFPNGSTVASKLPTTNMEIQGNVYFSLTGNIQNATPIWYVGGVNSGYAATVTDKIDGSIINLVNSSSNSMKITGALACGMDENVLSSSATSIGGPVSVGNGIYTTVSGKGFISWIMGGNAISGNATAAAAAPANGSIVNANSATGYAIVNNIDLSQMNSNGAAIANTTFDGGMQGNGTVNGGILNYLKAGTDANATDITNGVSGTAGFGTVYGGNGASGTNLTAAQLTNNLSGSGLTLGSMANVATFLKTPISTTDAYAKATAQSVINGGTLGIYTYDEGGIFNGTAQEGGSFDGYVSGATVLEVGDSSTAPANGVGGSGMVSNAAGLAAGNYTFSNSMTNPPEAGNIYASGGINLSSSSLYPSYNPTDPSQFGADYFQNGNSTLILNNVESSQVYGGEISGILDGTSETILNKGVFSQLNGADSQTLYQTGSSYVVMNGGQVTNSFHGTGGGTYYGTATNPANVLSIINGGYVNCGTDAGWSGLNNTPGALTYDATDGIWKNTTLSGNSTLDVIDGNFNDSNISSGMQKGIIQGNSTVNITGLSSVVKSGAIISANAGAQPVGNGTSQNAVNIDLTNGKLLNGASVYGDSGSANGYTYSYNGTTSQAISGGLTTNIANINMNIQAPGASLGTVAATAYAAGTVKNYLGNTISGQTSTALMIGDGISFNNLSGGGTADNYTNTANPTNLGSTLQTASLLLGDGSGQGAITSMNAIENFTALNVNNGAWTGAPSGSLDTNTAGADNALTLNIGGLGILNGSGATAANHYNTYNQSGNLTVGNGVTLNEDYGNGTMPANAPISVANASLGAGDILQQGYTTNTGLFNLSNLTMPTGSTLQWQPQGSAPSLNDTSATSTELGEFGFGSGAQYVSNSSTSSLYNGLYQGKQLGYPVLTFTGGTGYATTDTEGLKEPGTANTAQTTANGSNFMSTATAWGQSLYGDLDNSQALQSSQTTNLGTTNAEIAVMSPTGTTGLVAPDIDFGTYRVNPSATLNTGGAVDTSNGNSTQALQAYDTVFSKWATGAKLQVELTTPLTAGTGATLTGVSYQSPSSTMQNPISGAAAIVKSNSSFGYDNISQTDQSWNNTNSQAAGGWTANTQGTGLNLTVSAGTPVAAGSSASSPAVYHGTLTWSYENVPN